VCNGRLGFGCKELLVAERQYVRRRRATSSYQTFSRYVAHGLASIQNSGAVDCCIMRPCPAPPVTHGGSAIGQIWVDSGIPTGAFCRGRTLRVASLFRADGTLGSWLSLGGTRSRSSSVDCRALLPRSFPSPSRDLHIVFSYRFLVFSSADPQILH
jgi:hypothetical protein